MRVLSLLQVLLTAMPALAQFGYEFGSELVARDAVLEAREAYIDALVDLHAIEARDPGQVCTPERTALLVSPF